MARYFKRFKHDEAHGVPPELLELYEVLEWEVATGERAYMPKVSKR